MHCSVQSKEVLSVKWFASNISHEHSDGVISDSKIRVAKQLSDSTGIT